jgi:hypothetical protein
MLEPTTEESSRRPGKYRRSLADIWLRSVVERRWWATTFTRQGFMDALRNLAWVAPLTILIWIYAEREQIGTPTLPDVTIQIVGSNLFVTPDQSHVSLALKGPQNGLETVQLALGKLPGLQIDISNIPGRGHQHINVMDHIQNLSLFRDTGVSVTKVEPGDIDVDVDDFVYQPIPVQNPPNATNLESTTHYEPSTVKAHGPKSVINGLMKQGTLAAYADLESVGTLTPGQHDQIVGVSLAAKDTSITLEPSSVKAFLDVGAQDETMKVPSMPILVKAPPDLVNAYEVKLAVPSATDITVIGPPKQLALIGTTIVPTAVLTITTDDIDNPQPKQLDYQLPAQVKVSDNDKVRTFEFTLVKRLKND